jgi:hypothetical protein
MTVTTHPLSMGHLQTAQITRLRLKYLGMPALHLDHLSRGPVNTHVLSLRPLKSEWSTPPPIQVRAEVWPQNNQYFPPPGNPLSLIPIFIKNFLPFLSTTLSSFPQSSSIRKYAIMVFFNSSRFIFPSSNSISSFLSNASSFLACCICCCLRCSFSTFYYFL